MPQFYFIFVVSFKDPPFSLFWGMSSNVNVWRVLNIVICGLDIILKWVGIIPFHVSMCVLIPLIVWQKYINNFHQTN